MKRRDGARGDRDVLEGLPVDVAHDAADRDAIRQQARHLGGGEARAARSNSTPGVALGGGTTSSL